VPEAEAGNVPGWLERRLREAAKKAVNLVAPAPPSSACT